jgi:hypothetical protein
MASASQLSIKELTPARPLRYGHPQAREGERVDPGPLGRCAEAGFAFGSRGVRANLLAGVTPSEATIVDAAAAMDRVPEPVEVRPRPEGKLAPRARCCDARRAPSRLELSLMLAAAPLLEVQPQRLAVTAAISYDPCRTEG